MNESTTYLVRLSGTVSTKATGTRRRFLDRLEANIRDALERFDIDYQFEGNWSRVFVEAADPRVPELLSRICGVQSVRPSHGANWSSMDEIVELGAELFADRVPGKTFAVDAQRVGQREKFPFDSVDVNYALGSVLDEAGGEVDLDDPDLEVPLEIHHDQVYFYDRDLPGPGGLPIGVEGRALALVSGGFDSAVAAWLMLKRGVALDFVFCNLGGPAHEQGVRSVIGALEEKWLHGYQADLHVVDFRPLLADLKVEVEGQYWQVVLKRLMMRAGDQIARRHGGYSALITGESIGQVSSQTLGNLAAIEDPIASPIFRPLASWNKEDIVELTRELGLHERAEQVSEFCALDGGKPVTNTNASRLDDQEANLDLSMLERLVDDRRTEPLRELSAEETELDVQIEHVPDQAALLDLRSEQQYERWHGPEAMNVPFETAIDQYQMLPREPTWVLYCEVGLKSALIAEKMNQHGFDAYSFRGGVPRLKKWLDQRDEVDAL
jgi:thiamine biosynthesis protein ThiI